MGHGHGDRGQPAAGECGWKCGWECGRDADSGTACGMLVLVMVQCVAVVRCVWVVHACAMMNAICTSVLLE
jgi:hypothetical protein